MKVNGPAGQEQRRNRHWDPAATACVIPTLRAAATLAAAIRSAASGVAETVVVDAGSSDGTPKVARLEGARVLQADPGRGSQLAAGIAATDAPWLLLLHADTRLAAGWTEAAAGLTEDRAGYFRLRLDSAAPQARRLERLVAWRCRRLGMPYGDQGLLISRALLRAAGGMRALPLMEDVDLVRRLGRSRLQALAADALTSAAKWERQGWYRRSARNLACLALYRAGMPPRLIARLY